MKKFYTHNGTEQQGPFDLEDLKSQNIKRETQIWYDGLDDWTTADKIDELKSLFQSMPPPIPKITPTISSSPNDKKPMDRKSKLNGGIVVAGAIIIVFAFAIIINYYPFQSANNPENNNQSVGSPVSNSTTDINATYSSPPPKPKTPEELKQELKSDEQNHPGNYLSVHYSYKYKVYSNRFQIDGTLTNSATVATFKDVILSVSYYTQTNTFLKTEDYVVYKYVYPNGNTSFSLNVEVPSGGKKVNIKVKTASH